jgi:hypothetical protein
VPQFLADFPAQVLIVTAFPELYFDEDVHDWDARVAYERALGNLRRLASLAVGVFSAAPPHAGQTPSLARRRFFPQLCAAAGEVWRFTRGEGNRLGLICERAIVGATGQRAAGRGGLYGSNGSHFS